MVSDPTESVDPEQKRSVAAARGLADLVQQASASEVADDHTLTVTVGPGNTLTGLELTRQALRHDSGTLSALIIDTAIRAADRLQEELREAAAQAGASDPGTVGLLGGELPAPESPAPESQEPDDDGDAELDALLEEAERVRMPSAWAGRVPDDTADPEAPLGADDDAEDGPMAALRAMERNARQQAARYAEIYDELRTMTATGSSAENLVTATVGHGNALRELEFAPAAFRHGPKRVAEFVLAAVQRASAELSQRIAERLQDGVQPALDIRALVEPYLPEEAGPTEGLAPSADRPRPRATRGWNSTDEGT